MHISLTQASCLINNTAVNRKLMKNVSENKLIYYSAKSSYESTGIKGHNDDWNIMVKGF